MTTPKEKADKLYQRFKAIPICFDKTDDSWAKAWKNRDNTKLLILDHYKILLPMTSISRRHRRLHKLFAEFKKNNIAIWTHFKKRKK